MLFQKSTFQNRNHQLLSPRINHCCRSASAWRRSRAASRSTKMLPRQRRRMSWLDLDLTVLRCTHASKKIHNLYMCSWAFGIGLKIPKVSKTPGLHPSWSQRLKSDRPERFWVDVASLTHQGILRDLGMLPRSIEKCFHIKMERSAAQHGWHFWCQNSYISETNIAQKTFPKDLRFRAGCISMRRWWSSMVYVGVHWALASPCMCFGKRICVHSWLHAADSVHAACVHFKWEITATNNIYIYTYVDGLQPESWSGKASIQYDLSIGKDKK